MDRIVSYIKHRTGFHIEYNERFDEGELKTRFNIWPGQGISELEFENLPGHQFRPVVDKIPESEIVKCENGKYTISANVYGDGIKMFLLSQGHGLKC